ncbi:FadR/GntR family transcriptional regulator [Caldisalinibacter kiritimatiensis]|uniref:Lactate-responsive regulator LldR, GntR family n=1 Tax=Caldisalinibacter kiritimatiensis TaxID=1304284 RepID=R1CSB9_9FIRM|nr:FadR/GntR family transcriptional regulator [Caldisalinibacter kiritimatiensis]EOD01546.1 Lactate-responsive regulator LldR, GntR family [Caldisalinibacter kiritimatiensis]
MFKPIKNKKVYEYVIEQIQQMVMDGALKKGDRLPSERELAEQLQVSRTSIREALRALEVIGLIETKQGEGNFITGKIEDNLFEPLSVMFMLNKGNPIDILEVRKIIEVEAVTLASERIKQEELKELERLLYGMRDTNDEKESAKLDKEFHFTIAKATGNYLIVSLFHIISSLIESFIENARFKILRRTENKKILFEQHREIFINIKERNSKKAKSLMAEHLEFVNKIIINK